MLEFKKDFFEQEIRNGFYIDVTMKTLWAAELEVLQKIAEICDRHGITWYAAYGTLLGAVRHEGFVPWDDDMDIWVKRKDYNRLLKILPAELPQGYLVRNCMADDKFDQFHTCVNSGDGISLEKEWLEQYHGCPFTVGLDIFPLDYLPRDEEARKMQENLFSVASQSALLAAALVSSEANEIKENEEIKRSTREQVKEGVRYLKETCGANIEEYLIENEDWEQVVPELWKWANYIAMMYGEEESDYLVCYVYYARNSLSKFPKECFAETYGAAFEGFMLPVPCGYERLLRLMYGTYRKICRKTGTHEYPYYARQLRWLRERVRANIIKATELGVAESGAILSLDKEMDLTPEWDRIVRGVDGQHKKVVLMANDVAIFCTYGTVALEKLQEVLQVFEKEQDQIALWWRPGRQMAERLAAVSSKFAERYQEILRRYKEGGWGICDETDNIDRAVERCDIYYGDMNAILQPFQNAGKPILLMENGSERCPQKDTDDGCRETSNRDRQIEYRTFLSLSDYAEDDRKLYFSNTNYNGLTIVEKATWSVEQIIPFEGEGRDTANLHLRYVKKNGKICFLPAQAQYIHIYDIESGTQSIHSVWDQDVETKAQGVWDDFVYGDQVYLLPGCSGQELRLWDASGDSIRKEQWWNISMEEAPLGHGVMDEKSFFSYGKETNRLYITDLRERDMREFYLPDDHIKYVTYDGKNFWYVLANKLDIVCWNRELGEVERHRIQGDSYGEYDSSSCCGIHYAGGRLFLFFRGRHQTCVLCVLDETQRTLRKIHSLACSKGEFCLNEMEATFKKVGDKLFLLFKNAAEIVSVDLETLECEQRVEDFHLDIQKQKQVYPILLDKGALLYEVPGIVDLHTLIEYCQQT